MSKKLIVLWVLGFLLVSAAPAQAPPAKKAPAKTPLPGDQLADAMTQRLADGLQIKTVLGEPIKAGRVTLVPVIMVDIGFGGGGAFAPQNPNQGSNGFFMSGEARPLGFIVITKSGTRFISVGKVPRN